MFSTFGVKLPLSMTYVEIKSRDLTLKARSTKLDNIELRAYDIWQKITDVACHSCSSGLKNVSC